MNVRDLRRDSVIEGLRRTFGSTTVTSEIRYVPASSGKNRRPARDSEGTRYSTCAVINPRETPSNVSASYLNGEERKSVIRRASFKECCKWPAKTMYYRIRSISYNGRMFSVQQTRCPRNIFHAVQRQPSAVSSVLSDRLSRQIRAVLACDYRIYLSALGKLASLVSSLSQESSTIL